jgi:hypothetical protein
MNMKLTPIGLAAKLIKGNRFELDSEFSVDTGLPVNFAISLYDRDGLRYSKSSYYDFKNKVLRWEKSYPPKRNRKNFIKIYELSDNALSPLSAVYQIMEGRHEIGKDAATLKIQVQDIPYIAHKTAETEEKDQIFGEHESMITVQTYSVGKDAGRVEPWRRRKDVKIGFLFSCGAVKLDERSCFPFRITLPFNVLTMERVESSQQVSRK